MIALVALAATLSLGSGTATDSALRNPKHGRVTGPTELAALVARLRVPSFSRQTKLACGVCHYGFPQLTPFGRMFKLNGYTMTGLTPIIAQTDSASRLQLQLSPIAPFSVMAVVSSTTTAAAEPGKQGSTAQFPQQLSFFAASGLTPKMGIFSQVTYTQASGKFGIDNTDVRFADHRMIGGKDVLYGLTLNNNPTVQDVWNSTPAWSYPFSSASVAPVPVASTLLEGALAQRVLGLGAYSLIDNALYAEVSGYVSSPQGAALPADSSATNTSRAVSPYWRVALQHQFESTYLMIGTFGLSATLYPRGVSGPWDRRTDVGVDAQLEQKIGNGMLIGRASYVHEDQKFTASFAATPSMAQNLTNTLSTYKANVSYRPDLLSTLTLGYFGSSGSSDKVLYGPSSVTGSSTGSPGSEGETLEYSVNPWLNVRLGAQYVIYQRFNGASRSYDIPATGRDAKDNNTLYLYLWFAY